MNRRLKILMMILAGLGLVFAYMFFFPERGGDGNKIIVAVDDKDGAVETMPIDEGKEVLKMLDVLRTIELDMAFFDDELFQGLIDFSVELAPEEAGRPNPFAPLE